MKTVQPPDGRLPFNEWAKYTKVSSLYGKHVPKTDEIYDTVKRYKRNQTIKYNKVSFIQKIINMFTQFKIK